jgi:NAD+ diphosphatase
MKLADLFDFCPRCGSQRASSSANPFHCATCGHTQYFNPAVAVAAILLGPDNRVLLLRRAKDPGKGKLGLPGGFVDVGETAEDALRREIREEVNLEVNSLEFLCTLPNEYQYKEVAYPVLDLFFIARALSAARAAALDGVESFLWVEASRVDFNEMAFRSNAEALRYYCGRR